jgi:hypothetical protein
MVLSNSLNLEPHAQREEGQRLGVGQIELGTDEFVLHSRTNRSPIPGVPRRT